MNDDRYSRHGDGNYRQGYPPSVPASRAGGRHHDASQPYFEPPPIAGYDDGDYVPPREVHDHYGVDPYAQSGARPQTTEMAAYDDEIAEAGYRRGYEDTRAYTHLPPPPSDHELGRRPRRHRSVEGSSRYDDRSEYSDDDSYADSRSRDRGGRRRYSDEERTMDRRSRSRSEPRRGGREAFGGLSESEVGLGAKLVGGGAGALLGRKLGKKSALSTVAGAVVGSIAATAIEKQIEQRRGDQARGHRVRGDEERDGERTRPRSRSRSGFRERLRSLSRRGARSLSAGPRRTRRSDSFSSEESFRRPRY
ncbi:unnamed protein product [Zymoseptoria tritici ST99CH_1A5]|uniref:Uncharacterized protein n=3 Tax=Zymoseptoria tritici TaxID=1047171 RepID=F9XLN3_ZYMTI|nr:uncharacterized protein MYCGRDRAFT_96164 [Zymoseptoria tritici IPO323]EGP83808.1 hypothetical protein MYCGRDRAFT_96164 [Zymoseptoria tritici IPO323]SMR59054.1 unnamed protein product [Zymoseptoria tritici ST99CH_1E4]SMY28264.1 unnamed protein product [Zymoseptoria tritici ST99CH_1A5]